MKGLELSQQFYEQYGVPMLEEDFPGVVGLVAVGLAGSGSECFGYDDEISRDHDFEPGFCIFVPDEGIVDNKTFFELERAYSKLPREFMGYTRSLSDPVGGKRHGVIRISDFFAARVGAPDGRLSDKDWFLVPEQSLAEVTNGRIFRDDSGEFTRIRQDLSYLPDNVRLKKLAGNLLNMAQAGQYNYNRCIGRGETAAAQLAAAEFVKSTLNAVFLLNRAYIPYYKWCFRALRDLPLLSQLYDRLEYLISNGNTDEQAMEKVMVIEDICSQIADELRTQELTTYLGTELEGHAYSVNNKITDGHIRNLHILYGV